VAKRKAPGKTHRESITLPDLFEMFLPTKQQQESGLSQSFGKVVWRFSIAVAVPTPTKSQMANPFLMGGKLKNLICNECCRLVMRVTKLSGRRLGATALTTVQA